MAIENQWGGSDSLQKSHQLAADLFSWFSKSKALVPVEDLENLLHECMLLTFNTEIEDGSIEQESGSLSAITLAMEVRICRNSEEIFHDYL
ncbi:hypothetical protein VNO80_08542 [Phaseolus coccineus]|uniref:Pre-rRNA-processing protein TSR2 homolog n=1 Tax=Phaseolus coccineus TaxID=3886 RepID=A0AAN9N9Z4_PHACN